MRTWPEPKRPMRAAWRMVVRPLMRRAAKAPQVIEAGRLVGDAHDDDDGEDHRGNDEDGGLDAGADGDGRRRVFVGFVADTFVDGGGGQR